MIVFLPNPMFMWAFIQAWRAGQDLDGYRLRFAWNCVLSVMAPLIVWAVASGAYVPESQR